MCNGILSLQAVFINGVMMRCNMGKAFVFASFYIVFLWLGQFVFVTMFLGLILENFSVVDFMSVEKNEDGDSADDMIDMNDARIAIAIYQKLPAELVGGFPSCPRRDLLCLSGWSIPQ